MDAHRSAQLRRVAMMAALAALALPAAPAQAAKKAPAPVITSVKPMNAIVGDTLTITGRNFRKGKGRNSVGFKRDGAAVVFVKTDISTTRMLKVKVPTRLQDLLAGEPARFHLRVLAARFGKAFTPNKLSPSIGPKAAAAPALPVAPGAPAVSAAAPDPAAPSAPEADCDADGVLNGADADDDNDLLSDVLENAIGSAGCKADSDTDGIGDGYEYRSGIDLNDDEYQQPNQTLAAPVNLGYPNPLLEDAGVDYDGDGLTMADEYALWLSTTPAAQRTLADVTGAATPLNYSEGLQFSKSRRCGPADDGTPVSECNDLSDAAGSHDGRRVPSLSPVTYDKAVDFRNWLVAAGYDKVYLHDAGGWFDHADGRYLYDILDVDRSRAVEYEESSSIDRDANGWLSDDERDEDADGLSNIVELHSEGTPAYWAACYSSEPVYTVSYPGTDPNKADTDGDGVRDGADDQDHDDVPNLAELSRMKASHLDDTDNGANAPAPAEGDPPATPTTGGGPLCKPDLELDPEDAWHPTAYGQVNPFNPCLPDRRSRTCARFFEFGTAPAPFSGPNWWSLQ